jgi:rhodanese-related sulfurtransferase
MADLEDAIVNAKDKMPNVTPTPPGFHSQATATELKSRLQWGEPGLTILDVRDHEAFNQCRIMGAISMPMEQLPQWANFGLQQNRDIYVYGNTDDDTASAANLLREAGFTKIAELKGGLADWQAIDAPVEGTATAQPPSAGAYNVGDRLREFAEERAKEKQV